MYLRSNKLTLLLLLAGLAWNLQSCRKIGPDVTEWPDPTPYVLEIPSHMPAMPDNPDNPLTVEGVALGRMLFYDPILSADSTQSCASCHAQEYAFTDHNKQFSEGIDGLQGNMNAMAIINLGWSSDFFFWNGRAGSLEEQALGPVENPIEMHNTWPVAVATLQAHPDYPELFGLAFGTDEISADLVSKAIAQFERTIISANSRYDVHVRHDPGDDYTNDEFYGQQLFFDENGGDCFHCHSEALMNDTKLRNNGLDSVYTDMANWGYFEISGDSSDLGKFKAPTLRNIELTAPYMHDGRFATLEEVLDHYNEGLSHSENMDPLLNKPTRAVLTPLQKYQIIQFLKTLTDTSFITNPAYSDPFK